MTRSLFEVCRKSDNSEIVSVYSVRDDKNGYPHFLIHEDNEWKYVKAKHFVPVERWFERWLNNEKTREI